MQTKLIQISVSNIPEPMEEGLDLGCPPRQGFSSWPLGRLLTTCPHGRGCPHTAGKYEASLEFTQL